MIESMDAYLNKFVAPKPDWVIDMEQKAEDNHVPIMESVGIDFMLKQIKIHQPKKILEVGTAIGYSALRMHEANPQSVITTIEKDEERYNEALRHIKKLGKKENIQIILGDAIEVLKELQMKQETFDFIFLDAAKGKYLDFFELAHPMLEKGGILVTDNVLFRGFVAEPENAPKRFKNMVKKIDAYNAFMCTHPDYITSILPIGDGVMLSYRT